MNNDDVTRYKSDSHMQIIVVPTAVAESASPSADPKDVVTPDEESFKAIAWASKLTNDSNVLSLIHSLPKQIVEEQVRLYRNRPNTAVAKEPSKIHIGSNPHHRVRMLVGQRFHLYCYSRGIRIEGRMPYGAMKTFVNDNIEWNAKRRTLQAHQIRRWYKTWKGSASNALAVIDGGADKAVSIRSLLKSKAPKQLCHKERADGAGRPFKLPLVRQALYEWWSSIRYAIDWQQLIATNRSRGTKTFGPFSSLGIGSQSKSAPPRLCPHMLAQRTGCGGDRAR